MRAATACLVIAVEALRRSTHSLHDVAHGRELVEGPYQIYGAIEDQLLEHDPSPLQVVLLYTRCAGQRCEQDRFADGGGRITDF